MSSALLPVYPRLPLTLVRAEGAWLYPATGERLLDMYGGHAVTPLGHNHPALAQALREGFATLDFYSNSLEMTVQEEAARALLADSRHLAYVHFVNSGTEANESALHLARRLTGRRKVLSFDCGFHGRTLASLAATGLGDYRRRLSPPADPANNAFLPFGELSALPQIDGDTAAVLCESVPSLAGIRLPPEGYYPALAARCRAVGAWLIFDEVQGGMGRLGQWFAHQRFGVEPDVVTLAKSIAGGFPAGAMLTTRAIGEQTKLGELGTTFGGGPLACALIRTVVRVIDDGLLSRVALIFARIAAALGALPGVTVRGAGCLIGIETAEPATALRVCVPRRRDCGRAQQSSPHAAAVATVHPARRGAGAVLVGGDARATVAGHEETMHDSGPSLVQAAPYLARFRQQYVVISLAASCLMPAP